MLLNFVKLGGLKLSGKTISWAEIFLGGNFQGGNDPWWEFSGWELSRWELSCVGIFQVGIICVPIFWVGVFLNVKTPNWKIIKLQLVTDIDMLLMVENGIRGGICHAIHRYAKVNNKYMKDCYKNKESSYLKCWDVNNLHGWIMSQKLPVYNFKWIKDTSQFNKDFIKSYNEESDEGYFPEVDV